MPSPSFGGVGTIDELFEILTPQQTRKAPPMPIVLFGRDYWRRIVDFDGLVAEGMIAAEDIAPLRVYGRFGGGQEGDAAARAQGPQARSKRKTK
jgi:predicted Rossmann-fold nucleotide-binding protein